MACFPKSQAGALAEPRLAFAAGAFGAFGALVLGAWEGKVKSGFYEDPLSVVSFSFLLHCLLVLVFICFVCMCFRF